MNSIQFDDSTPGQVLVIDQNAEYRAMIHEVVHESVCDGWRSILVSEAESSSAANQRYTRYSFDLMIIDPETSHDHALPPRFSNWRDHWAFFSKRILIHSATPVDSRIINPESGVHYLKKPCALDALESAIRLSLGFTETSNPSETRLQLPKQSANACCRRVV